jgi:hypothetical protein
MQCRKVEEKFEEPVFEEVEFRGKRAGKLSALWQNEKQVCEGVIYQSLLF